MEKLRLGRTGMMVSKLGFGGIPIQRLSDEEAVAVVKRCVELGVTFLDTANAYTTSEERIGRAIKGQREKLIIATKSGARNREGVEAHLKLSLQHLGVDYIDLYQFHGVNDFKNLDMVLESNGPMAAVQEAKKAGLVRHIGITSHQMDVAKKAVQSDLFETIMFPFNFITHEAAEELLPLARKHDVGFIAMKPMAGGMLDNATIAFKYLFQFPDVVPIPGIEKIPEIEEIVGILEKPREMTAAELREMQRLRQELGTRFCHRCDYCQPCASEIPISTVLTSRSFAKRLPPERFFSGWIVAAIERAADCTECGDCETRCPYHLPIREMLAEQVKWYQAEKKCYDELLATRGTGKVRR
jgi:predicted aldo/keto reductase-like oxidoreductase